MGHPLRVALLKKGNEMLTRKRYTYIGYLYILPWIIGFLVLQLAPLINSFWYSFTNFQLLGDPKFLGLDNYKKIFTNDPTFLQSLKVTSYYVLIAVPLKLSFALLIAIILNQNIKGIRSIHVLLQIGHRYNHIIGMRGDEPSLLQREPFPSDPILRNAKLPGAFLLSSHPFHQHCMGFLDQTIAKG